MIKKRGFGIAKLRKRIYGKRLNNRTFDRRWKSAISQTWNPRRWTIDFGIRR